MSLEEKCYRVLSKIEGNFTTQEDKDKAAECIFLIKNNHYLVDDRKREMIDFLSDKGANMNYKNEQMKFEEECYNTLSRIQGDFTTQETKDKAAECIIAIAKNPIPENNSREKMVKILVEKGANVNYIKDGKTLPIILSELYPLNEYYKINRVIEFLIENGASTIANGSIDEGISTYDLFVNFKYPISTKIFYAKKYLHNNPNNQRKFLDYLSEIGFVSRVIQLSGIEELNQIIDLGIDLNLEGRFGHIPLTILFYNKKTDKNEKFEKVKLLLENGANPNLLNKYGDNPFIMAVSSYPEMVELFLDNGANPSIQNKYGNNPLIMAANENNIKIVELLLEKDADPNIKDKFDGNTALIEAANKNHIEIVKLLLKKGAKPDIQAKNQDTALIKAAGNGYVEIVKLLLEKDANPNIEVKFDGPRTALTDALNKNHIKIAELLLKNGANPNIQDKIGNTPLIIVEYSDNVEMVKLLLEKGADPNLPTNYGTTPLIIAIDRLNKEIIKLLVENGADLNIINRRKETPLEYFERKRKKEEKYINKSTYSQIKKLLKPKTSWKFW